MKIALITGITGQDGSYLSELLLSKGYKVHGLVRRSSTPNFWRLESVMDRIQLHDGDINDLASLVTVIAKVNPDEVYNLAAQSFVATSWRQPIMTGETTAISVTKMLEAVKIVNPRIRFYQASSSEMYGKVNAIPQNEDTPFYPRSPYAVAKVYGHYATVNHRESYGTFAVSGILFNHESPRRGIEFVTRKIADGVAQIAGGRADRLVLGNLDAKRDWGFARDYVEAMWLMLQQDQPEDFVVSTGETHTVREFAELAFKRADLDIDKYLRTSDEFKRPAEVDLLLGDPTKARLKLGWKAKTSFNELVNIMVDAELERYGIRT